MDLNMHSQTDPSVYAYTIQIFLNAFEYLHGFRMHTRSERLTYMHNLSYQSTEFLTATFSLYSEAFIGRLVPPSTRVMTPMRPPRRGE